MHIGQPPKIDQGASYSQPPVDSSFLPRPPLGKEFFKNPKSLLNEFCQSMKFSSPSYQNQRSENGVVVTTVFIRIEGQEVHYSYTSEEAVYTKKHIKQCEESVAEIALIALTKLYGTSIPKVSYTQSYTEQPGKQQILAICILGYNNSCCYRCRSTSSIKTTEDTKLSKFQ